jgi:hypothetical protein
MANVWSLRSNFATFPARCRRVLLLTASVFIVNDAMAQNGGSPLLETNMAYVEAVTADTVLPIDDKMAVFKFVLGSLSERVKVYPTENYFYFRFTHHGVRYAGDIRLAAIDRDHGKLHFDLYEEMAGWKLDGGKIGTEVVLDAAQGVRVDRIDKLTYRVGYAEKSVVFELNDLSQVTPPARLLGPDEKFIGPIFDESAVRFFLVYNSALQLFYFILDETAKVPDELAPIKQTDRILIGQRTGFAFYRDSKLDRKILIGAYELNSLVNNYFDGPFDQLPENFIEGTTLQDLIIDSDPGVKGKIDRLGNYNDGKGRYLIHPYLLYRKDADLLAAHRCATSKRVKPALYYACFVFDQGAIAIANPQPLALMSATRRRK